MNRESSESRSAAPDLEGASEPEGPDRYPATLVLCAVWAVVYLVMAWHQGALHANPASWLAGGIRPQTAYIFGALTSHDVQNGDYWRLLTATMLHFSLVHLAINAWVMFQLGRMIEPWYGSSLFLAAYVVIGGGANLIAAVLRPWTGQSILLQSGGGSGVICGLIALVGVVGWRSRSRFGAYMLRQMAVQLLLIGAMGWLIPNIDNLVHAAGAVMGIAVGLADRWMLARAGRWSSRGLGLVAAGLLLGSGVAQYLDQRAEENRQRDTLIRIARLDVRRRSVALAATAFRRVVGAEPGGDLRAFSTRDAARAALALALDRLEAETELGPTAELQVFERIGRSALERRPDPGQVRRFLEAERRISGPLLDEERALALRLQELERRRGPVKIRLPAPERVIPPGRKPETPPHDDGGETPANATP